MERRRRRDGVASAPCELEVNSTDGRQSPVVEMSQLCRSIASFRLQSGERETGAVRGAVSHERPTPPPLPLFPALPPRRLAESSKSNILNDEENETWETAIRELSPPPHHHHHHSTRHPPHPSNEACIHHSAHGASKQTREV